MADYKPRGFVVLYRELNSKEYQKIYLEFDGIGELKSLSEWRKEKGFSYSPPQLSPTDFYAPGRPAQVNGQLPPPCPEHGAGRWIKPNKGRGKHKFYCAYQLEEGGYCGKKIG